MITARSHGLPLHLDLAVARFLDIRRTREPQPADFDHTSPALLARALSDLTPDERHVLRSVSLLDAFALDLATRAAGLTHQAPARRLTERPIVQANPDALWHYHLHGAIRSALTEADDHTDDAGHPRLAPDRHPRPGRPRRSMGHEHRPHPQPHAPGRLPAPGTAPGPRSPPERPGLTHRRRPRLHRRLRVGTPPAGAARGLGTPSAVQADLRLEHPEDPHPRPPTAGPG